MHFSRDASAPCHCDVCSAPTPESLTPDRIYEILQVLLEETRPRDAELHKTLQLATSALFATLAHEADSRLLRIAVATRQLHRHLLAGLDNNTHPAFVHIAAKALQSLASLSQYISKIVDAERKESLKDALGRTLSDLVSAVGHRHPPDCHCAHCATPPDVN